ncbi:hypothetical protein IAR55_006637 [Kwoniella newhampshirensis]|uniref:Major facilitator superfamily (MFS) profile domain-containing protein n=1 Tax=Kwoniella newhampshirensis TaxID=1651941 RepID=A0AAW0YRM3_9TREE
MTDNERTPLVPKIGVSAAVTITKLDFALILPALLGNNFLAAFESTIAASTQSAVGTSFNASTNAAWVATSYLIVSTAVQPLYGRASDLFGRTRLYVFSLTFFALGCLGCGMSRSLAQMVVARAICGIGGGGLITVSQVCAWDILPMKSRPLYQAVNNVTYGLGAAVGASLGGLLSDSIGWRFAYLFPVPLSFFSILVFLYRARPKLVALKAGNRSDLRMADIDISGCALLMSAITLFMIVINLGGGEIPWSSPVIPLLLVCATLATIVFYRHERNVALPVLPVSLVKSRHMISQVGLNLFGAMTIFGVLYLIPVYFQTTLLTSASIASRRLLYPTLTAPIGSVLTGLFLHRHRDKCHLAQRIGAVVLFGGAMLMFLLTFEDNHGRGEWWFVSRLIWVHAGMGILFISSLIDILNSSGTEHAAATSLIFLLRSLGTVLGISGSQAVLQNVLYHQLSRHISGDNAPQIIRGIRESVIFLHQLEPTVRQVAVGCYVRSMRAAFGALAGVAGCIVLSAALGIGARSGENSVDDEDEDPTEPPFSEGIPVLD